MPELIHGLGMGWWPDYPDIRDYTPEHDAVQVTLKEPKVALDPPKSFTLPDSHHLRDWCSPIEDQESIGSCTAQAGVGLMEYFEKRAHGKYLDASRLFLYKATRNLLEWTGDTGAFLRTTMGALALFGVPPEKYWPYVIADYDVEPPAFCYAFAQNYQAIRYFRLDPPGTSRTALLNRVKYYILAGFPSMFGFTVYSSITKASSTGEIPFPLPGESVRGGHAVMAVGYDEEKKIKNKNAIGQSIETKGALLIRNSWGTSWGDAGYGWLPYDYVTKGLAVDWWSLTKNEWMDTGKFGF